MRFTIERKKLLSTIQISELAKKGVKQMAILANVKVTVDNNGEVAFVSSNLEQTIRQTVLCDDNEWIAGNAILNLAGVKKAISACKDFWVEISADEKSASLKCGQLVLPIERFDDADYPNLDFDYVQNVKIEFDELASAISKTVKYASNDLTRSNICGINFRNEFNQISCMKLVATDGHRLSEIEADCLIYNVQDEKELTSPDGLIVPIQAINVLEKIFPKVKGNGKEAFLYFCKNYTAFDFAGKNANEKIVLYAKNVDARFPEYHGVIPEGQGNLVINLDKMTILELEKAIEIGCSITTSKNNWMKLVFGESDTPRLKIETFVNGESATVFNSQIRTSKFDVTEFEKNPICFNGDYLTDVLKDMGDCAESHLYDAYSAMITYDLNSHCYKHRVVTMPVRM